MQILYNSLIAFEATVQMKHYSNPKNQITPYFAVEGPGIVIFQTCNILGHEKPINREIRFVIVLVALFFVCLAVVNLLNKYYYEKKIV
jgi:hypothetical protein